MVVQGSIVGTMEYCIAVGWWGNVESRSKWRQRYFPMNVLLKPEFRQSLIELLINVI
jgi:hypothetical protein